MKTSRRYGTRSTTWSPAWADPLTTDTLLCFADRIGCPFTDPDLLALALTHRSWCAEHAGHESNERLEFLGDAVLGLVVTAHVFDRFGELAEGELSSVRASVVNAAAMAEVAGEVGLGEQLRLGKGENASGGRTKLSILSDAMEAVIGAVFLDQGWPAAQQLVLRLLGDRIDIAADGPGGLDFKTQLQELVAHRFEQLPEYTITAEGPDHERRFFAVVHIAGEIQGEGAGRSKKLAEQAAASEAWRRLRVNESNDLHHIGDDHPDAVDQAPLDSGASVGSLPARTAPTDSGVSQESEKRHA